MTLGSSLQECNNSTGMQRNELFVECQNKLRYRLVASTMMNVWMYQSCKSGTDVCIEAFQGADPFMLKTDMGHLQLQM